MLITEIMKEQLDLKASALLKDNAQEAVLFLHTSDGTPKREIHEEMIAFAHSDVEVVVNRMASGQRVERSMMVSKWV